MNSFKQKKTPSIIKVLGVGGGGSNAVNQMFKQGITGVEFVICNTDLQAFESSPVPIKIEIGNRNGLGAGANPEVGKIAAEDSIEKIRELLSDESTQMLFITAGMGGGTGTGAAPVIAQLAREMGILTVGIVTLPFNFEGSKRRKQAELGIAEIKKHVDSLLVISNDKLRQQYGDLVLSDAYAKADNVLATAVRGIAELITVTGYVNVDFEDVKTVIKDSGRAIMGTARAEGEDRAIRAIEAAMNSPLLNDNDVKGATDILLYITTGNNDISMGEITEITEYVQRESGEDADIIWGTGANESLGISIEITMIALLQVSKKKNKKLENSISNKQAEGDEKAFLIGSCALEDTSISERAKVRLNKLKNLSISIPRAEQIKELENSPAYLRYKASIDDANQDSESIVSRFAFGNDDETYAAIKTDESVLYESNESKGNSTQRNWVGKILGRRIVEDAPEDTPMDMNEVENKIEELTKRFIIQKYKITLLKEKYFKYLTQPKSEEKIQFLPINIFLDTDDPSVIREVYESVNDAIKILDFEKDIEFDPIRGSWYKRFLAKSKDVLSDKEVSDRLKELEYSLEVKVLQVQSEVDKNQSEALLNILKSIEKIPDALIRIGSLLVVKTTAHTGEASVQVRTLTISELHLVNKYPDLLKNPKKIFSAFAEINNGESESVTYKPLSVSNGNKRSDDM